MNNLKTKWDVLPKPIYDEWSNPISGYKQIVRTDKPDTLHVAKDTYYPIYNSTFDSMANILINEFGCVLIDASSFKNGKWVYAQFENNEFVDTVIPGDNNGRIKGYITLANSHDGSLAFRLFSGIRRIFCQNTFLIANKYFDNMVMSVKHTRNHSEKIDALKEQFKDIATVQRDITKRMEAMSVNTTFEDPQSFAIDLHKLEKKPRPIKEKNEQTGGLTIIDWTEPKYSTRGENIISKLVETYDNYSDIDHSNWRMFNAVTDVVDHGLSLKQKNNGYHMFGTGNEIKVRAFNMLNN